MGNHPYRRAAFGLEGTHYDHRRHVAATINTAPAKRRDRTHWLYLAVIAAVVGGVIVGLVAPSVGKEVGVLGTMFVSLIKMMITPVIFCTIVLGIGSVRKAATVGKVGGLAFGYFLVMSTIALAIGLVVGNLLHPGGGLKIIGVDRGQGRRAGRRRPTSPAASWSSSSTSSRHRCSRR